MARVICLERQLVESCLELDRELSGILDHQLMKVA